MVRLFLPYDGHILRPRIY